MWPFARLAGIEARVVEALARTGISLTDFANPDTRVPHRIAVQLLRDTVKAVGDPTFGLRAGEQLEPGDFEVLEYAARCTATLGDAMRCVARYFRLMNDSAEITIVPVDETVEWRFRVTDDVVEPPASNDFVLAAALGFSRRNAAVYEAPLEIRFVHDRPNYAAAYERFGAPVKFGSPYNAIVIRKSRLLAPMLRANPGMSEAFELHAQELAARLDAQRGVAGRVREDVTSQLGVGTLTMQRTARRLAMSVATLRRRLEQEGTTFSDIVETTRKGLAEQYLARSRPAVSEIAFLLGFSDVASFDRAFKRWTGVSPTKYRASSRD
jgi:AraC-like DNA-binding protein